MDKYHNRWTNSEIVFLKENYATMTVSEISKRINRTRKAIATRASVLGLRKTNDFSKLHNKIITLVEAEYTVAEIATELGTDYSVLWKYLKDKNIKAASTVEKLNENALQEGFEEKKTKKVDYNKITFSDWYKRWYNTYKKGNVREVTRIKYRATYVRVKSQPLGTKRLKSISREDVQSYINWYGSNHSKQTVLDHMQTIRTCFKDALLDGHIERNPASNIKPIYKELNLSVMELKKIREKKKWLEADEYQKLKYFLVFSLQQTLKKEPIKSHWANMQSCEQIQHMIIFVVLKTGARISELLGLTINDANSETSEINIDKTWDYKNLNNGAFVDTKNISSIRKIAVDKETIDLINLYTKWLIDMDIEMKSDTLFIAQDGNFHTSTTNSFLKRLLESLDIEPITLHKLRHTQASYLIAKGVPLQVIAKRLGHTDTNMIRRVYGHLLKETEQLGNKMILELI